MAARATRRWRGVVVGAEDHPPQPGLFDLGRFNPEEARAAGYDCLVPPAP